VDAHWAYVLRKTGRQDTLDFMIAGIQRSVPPGAIFFGDSDPGRFAMSCAMEFRESDKRFWVLTQNQLTDSTYCQYVRFLSGDHIIMPTLNDLNPNSEIEKGSRCVTN